MKILVTGGTGYLGSRLIKSFRQDGHTIMCAKLSTDSHDNLRDICEAIQFVNVGDNEFSNEILKFSPDIVVHTACAYERGKNGYSQLISANLTFPLDVLHICMEAGTKRWINTATSLPYDLNSYALSKYQFSQWGKFYSDKSQLTFINLQLEHFYGENGPQTHFISWIINKLQCDEAIDLTEGTQLRDFVYVGDIENIFLSMLTQEVQGYWDIPVGTGVAPSIREVVEYLKKIIDSKSELRFGAVAQRTNEPSSCCDTTILHSLGLECKYQWKDGMKRLIGGSIQ